MRGYMDGVVTLFRLIEESPLTFQVSDKRVKPTEFSCTLHKGEHTIKYLDIGEERHIAYSLEGSEVCQDCTDKLNKVT